MKIHLSFIAAVMLSIHACTSNAQTLPPHGQSIYRAVPPFVDLKAAIHVRERERLLLPLIVSASNAIILFLIDMHDNRISVANIRQVTAASRPLLRLPPHATFGRSRFVDLLA